MNNMARRENTTAEIVADNFDLLYQYLIKLVITDGKLSAPRGMEIRELLGVKLTLTDPRRSLCTLKARKLNYKFAVIEKLEYVSGVSSPEVICHYNKNMASFLNEATLEFDGAYGPRLGRQYRHVYELLCNDPDTRQAVLNLNSELDKRETKDVPCTVSLQFLLRDGRLNLIAYMRSNDLLWGTPYDINGFCFIQEVMACWLGVKLGTYTHMAGSLHLYTERQESLEQLLKDNAKLDRQNPVVDNFNFCDRELVFGEAWRLEKLVRLGLIKDEPKLLETVSNRKLPFFIFELLRELL